MRFSLVLSVFWVLLAALAVSGLGTGRAAAQIPSPNAPALSAAPRKTWAYEINNKVGLVTVREKDGAYLFAQVLPSPDLYINFEGDAKTHKLRLTLQDARNKTLWQTVLGDGGLQQFGFSYRTFGDNKPGVEVSLSPRDATATNTMPIQSGFKGKVALGSDNFVSLANLEYSDNEGFRLERRGNELVMLKIAHGATTEVGRSSLGGSKDAAQMVFADTRITSESGGKSPIVLKDKLGTLTVRRETRDRKPYVVLEVGERRLLVEGDAVSYTVGENGEILLRITP